MVDGERNRRGAPARRRSRSPHLSRYGPFYAIGAAITAALLLLPGGDRDPGGAGGAATTVPVSTVAGGEWAPASGGIEAGTGVTRGGVECRPGVGQIPDTIYAAPCVPEFEGDNGGATARGVDAKTIRIVRRTFPDDAGQQALEDQVSAAGLATEDQAFEIGRKFLDYFNDNYELYGRRVEIVDYESQFGNSTLETLGEGREGACQDATKIVEELHAFAVIDSSDVFAECAAERGLLVFEGGLYMPEDWYESLHPYAWSLSMSCTVIADHVAEYIGKRMVANGDTADFAGGDLKGRTRVFGTYIADREQYLGCNERTMQLLHDKYGVADPQSHRITYALDISRFGEQAQRAVLQFKADGVTTVVLAADPISIGFMTAAAREQRYFPEWITIGTAYSDTDNFGRMYDQEEVDGHLFGVSTLPLDELMFGPEGEAGRLYEKLTHQRIPGGTEGYLSRTVKMFNFLQAAGPDLTAENLARGVQSLPPVGDDQHGIWSWRGDHTGREDAKEVYWDAGAEPSPAEADRSLRGRWIATDGGRRYQRGEWPSEPPAVYPG